MRTMIWVPLLACPAVFSVLAPLDKPAVAPLVGEFPNVRGFIGVAKTFVRFAWQLPVIPANAGIQALQSRVLLGTSGPRLSPG